MPTLENRDNIDIIDSSGYTLDFVLQKTAHSVMLSSYAHPHPLTSRHGHTSNGGGLLLRGGEVKKSKHNLLKSEEVCLLDFMEMKKHVLYSLNI